MSLADKLPAHQRKHALYKRAERVLRVTRQRIFDMEDAGLGWKAQRMMANCQRILAPKWRAEAEAAEHRRGQRILQTWA